MENSKCKIGTKVSVTRRNGDVVKGIIESEPAIRGKGEFVNVAFVDDKGKKTGKSAFYRPSQLTKR